VPRHAQLLGAERPHDQGARQEGDEHERTATPPPGDDRHARHAGTVDRDGTDGKGDRAAPEQPVRQRHDVEQGRPGVVPTVPRVVADQRSVLADGPRRHLDDRDVSGRLVIASDGHD
jgi:hypothetical protein